MENKPSDSSERLWRQPLSEADRARLSTRPELKAEARLTAALARISDAAVPSNFTARVLAAIELEEAQAARSRGWMLNWHRLWPRVAVASAVLMVVGVSLQRHEARSQRTALVKTVAMVAVAHPLPSVDVLENLDAIQRMSRSAHADGELLAALQ